MPVQLPFEQYLPWLHSLCSGDWIFRIDGDETPGAALLELLPVLIADDRVLQYRLPRRWLYPGAGEYLASAPWYPDYQVRLVRNDPATLRFRGTLHSSAEPILPARYLAEPIYHLALLGTSFEERQARVQRYGAVRFAVPNVDNAGFYLPELRKDAVLVPVPKADRELIERALLGVADVEGEPAPVRDVTLAEALRLSPIREVGPEAYDVELECLEPELRFLAGSAHEVPVRIRNRGPETFRWGDWSPAIRPSYHWLTQSGDAVVWDGHRTLLSHDLGPGEEAIVPLAVVAPPEPGEYLLEIDLVHEGVRWFGCGLRVPATVEGPAPRGAAGATGARAGTRGLRARHASQRHLRGRAAAQPDGCLPRRARRAAGAGGRQSGRLLGAPRRGRPQRRGARGDGRLGREPAGAGGRLGAEPGTRPAPGPGDNRRRAAAGRPPGRRLEGPAPRSRSRSGEP